MSDKYYDEPPPRLPPSPEEWETICRRAESAEAVMREMLERLKDWGQHLDGRFEDAYEELCDIARRHGLEVE